MENEDSPEMVKYRKQLAAWTAEDERGRASVGLVDAALRDRSVVLKAQITAAQRDYGTAVDAAIQPETPDAEALALALIPLFKVVADLKAELSAVVAVRETVRNAANQRFIEHGKSRPREPRRPGFRVGSGAPAPELVQYTTLQQGGSE